MSSCDPLVVVITSSPPASIVFGATQGPRGIAGPSGSEGNISSQANNSLTTGSDGGLFVNSVVDLGTFN